MAASLYDLSVASYLQTVDAVGGFLAKGLDHCQGYREVGALHIANTANIARIANIGGQPRHLAIR